MLMMQKYVDILHVQTIIRSCRRQWIRFNIGQWSDVLLLKLHVVKCKVDKYIEKNKYVMVQNNCTVELQHDVLKISE